MEQDTNRIERGRTGRMRLRDFVNDIKKRIKKSDGSITPESTRRKEKHRPNIIIKSGEAIRLTEAHTHGGQEDKATDYLALKFVNTKDGKSFLRPQNGDAVVQVFCDCENPNMEDINRTAIAVGSDKKVRDKKVLEALKVSNNFRPVNQRGISLHHPDDELINKDETKPDLLVSIPEQVDKTKLNEPGVKTRMQI